MQSRLGEVLSHGNRNGSPDAEIIKSDKVIVEERVRGKCIIPKCAYYGTNLNCPPDSPRQIR